MRLSITSSAWLLAPLALFALSTGGAACGGEDTGGSGGTGATGPGGGGTASTGGGGAAADKHVVVLFTSDEHSHLFAFSPELDDFPISNKAGNGSLVGGIARRAAVIKKERKAADDAGKDSILVSAGDNQMGCLPHVAFESESVDYQNMKALGYDVTTFGNHEFDFGPQALANSIDAAKSKGGLPPIVATNIHFSGTAGDHDLAGLYSDDATDSAPVHPYRVVTTKGGAKIGVIGYVGVNASHVAPNKTPVEFSEKGVPVADQGDQSKVLPKLYADLQPIVDKLRNDEGVNLVVALAHGGIDRTDTQEGIESGDDWNVCKNVGGIDFIVSGHAHNADPKPITVTNVKTKKTCLALNGSSFGRHLGRVEFTIPADKSKDVTFSDNALVEVSDKTIPDSAEAAAVPTIVEKVEKGTYLPALLGLVTGGAVTNNAGTPGDLYFFNIGHTDFDVTDTHSLIFLSADSMLSAADASEALGGPHTEIGLESAGVIRSILKKGKTGDISAADAFNVVPLGRSPVDGTIGYPLVRANITAIEMKLVLEFALDRGQTSSDYDLGFSGLYVEYDATAAHLQKVTKILIDSNHADGYDQFGTLDVPTVVYDIATGGFVNPSALHSIVTSSYIAQFAGDAGVTLRDDAGTADPDLTHFILHRADTSEVKQVESFLTYIHKVGPLPSLYDVTSAGAADRWHCTNGC